VAPLNSAAATAKWVKGLQGATQQITDGVNAVQVAPGVSAAKQVQVWLARIQASAPKWQANVSAVSLGEWQQAMITTGIPRIAQGATNKQGKYQAFADKFFPYLAQGQAQVRNMPKTSLADGINRAVAMINWNAKFSNKSTGA